MPRQRSPTAARQQRETIIQARGDLLEPELGDASCGKFDGQRDAIEMPTDRRDRGEAVTVGGEVPIQLSHPGDEQLHRATPQDIRWLLPMLRFRPPFA